MIIMRITKLLWSERTSAAPADRYSLHHQHKQSGTGESQVSHSAPLFSSKNQLFLITSKSFSDFSADISYISY